MSIGTKLPQVTKEDADWKITRLCVLGCVSATILRAMKGKARLESQLKVYIQ